MRFAVSITTSWTSASTNSLPYPLAISIASPGLLLSPGLKGEDDGQPLDPSDFDADEPCFELSFWPSPEFYCKQLDFLFELLASPEDQSDSVLPNVILQPGPLNFVPNVRANMIEAIPLAATGFLML